MLPPLGYGSRHARNLAIAGKRYFIEFDFAAYYDQFVLDESVRDHYVIRLKTPLLVDGKFHSLFTLTREPMGASHAAHVTQTFTWAMTEMGIKCPDVNVVTMIDNVAFASDNFEAFARCVRDFLRRVKAAGITLNPLEGVAYTEAMARSDDELKKYAEEQAKDFTFLGERYVDGRTCVQQEKQRKEKQNKEAWGLLSRLAAQAETKNQEKGRPGRSPSKVDSVYLGSHAGGRSEQGFADAC